MKLTTTQVDIIRLIGRSKPDAEGWCKVNPRLWPSIEAARLPPDLVEAQSNDGVHSLRLTESGKAIDRYI